MTGESQIHGYNERTALAWVQTAIATVGFGLATARISSDRSALWSELALLASGGAIVLVAFLRRRRLRRKIMSATNETEEGLATDGLLVALIFSLFATLAFFGLHVS